MARPRTAGYFSKCLFYKVVKSGRWDSEPLRATSEAARRLTVDLRHLLLAVARPGHLLRRKRRVERGHLVRHEPHIGRGDVLLEVLPSLRAGNRHDVRAFV